MGSKPKTAAKKMAKKPARKQRQPRQPKPSANLPEPIEVTAAQPKQSPPAKPADGLLNSLSNLFTIPQKAEPEYLSLDASQTFSTSEALPAESERVLASVPEIIGGEADDPGGPADVQELDPVAALMAQVAFEPQDVQDILVEMFDWLGERFQSDHWKLNERQARMLGTPAALMLNSIWARLQDYIPDLIAKWCMETPGASKFILACGLVIGPKIAKQITISRERKRLALSPQGHGEKKPGPVAAPRGPVTPVPAVTWVPQEGA